MHVEAATLSQNRHARPRAKAPNSVHISGSTNSASMALAVVTHTICSGRNKDLGLMARRRVKKRKPRLLLLEVRGGEACGSLWLRRSRNKTVSTGGGRRVA